METADVVIVGGGIVGVSTALFLAEAGVRNVVLLERATVGAGASGRAAGMMLLQSRSEGALRFQMESVRIHQRFRDEFGTDLQEHGSLLLWCSPQAEADARALVPFHRRTGVSVELLAPDEIQRRFPYLYTEDVAVATYSAADPWATPLPTVQRIAEAARARGVRIQERCEVLGVEAEEGRVQRVQTPAGAIHTPVVVNAAGAWARQVGAMTGVTVPVAPRKRQVFVVDPAAILPSGGPFIMEEEKDFYCKTRAEGLIMVQGQTVGETYETAVEWGYLDRALEITVRRIPALATAPITGAWAGIRPISPDGRPYLGPVPGLDGYFVAGGFGGQGFTQGPLGGKAIAELITTGRAGVDLSPYRVDRGQGDRASADGAASL
ncbi:MAG TPA: FAD-binding oxidoreductase [bacterium]|nr:FAD-binding oxidoreductase [bacterium]